ncbi:MAG: hypothetical protein AAB381_03375 [Patescibacteria group bacterium]
MKKAQSGVATVALIVIVGIAFLTGGTYVYTKVRQQDKSADALLTSAQRSLERSSRPAAEVAMELAQARASLRIEIDKLELFRSSSFNRESSYGWALALIQKEISDSVLSKTEDIFKLVSVAGIDPSIKITLSQDRQNLVTLVEAWQALYTNGQGISQATISSATQAVLDAAQAYVDALTTATNSLTPENTGTTPEVIDTHQSTVESVSDTVEEAVDTIDEAEPDQGDVEDIEEDIEDLEEELEETTSGDTGGTGDTTGGTGGDTSGTGTGTGTSGGDTSTTSTPYVPPPYVPPPVVDTSGKPQLIQGSNPF